LHARENLCSTGFGDGIAIPHCKLPGIQNFIAGIITVPDGVNFDAIDHRDIRLIVFLIGPKDLINDHIRLLAVISQKLHQKGFIEQLISEVKEENIIQCLVENPRIDLPHPCMHAGYDLLNIFVQDEEWFNEILQVLTGYESSQVVILDAQFEGSYLVKQPLFSNVWNDTNHKFCKVILAAIEKGVSGDIIRQLDHIVDGLDDCERLMITLQPLIYKAGALQF
jgi:PTS system nitrogen regulatory IIA component